MFNIGFKKEFSQNLKAKVLKRKKLNGSGEQMSTQVKKLLGQKEQGLILMVRG